MCDKQLSEKRSLTLMFILKKYLKSFGYALAGKILLRCLFNKFNLYKIFIEEPRYILKFAFASANVSGIFNLFRWVVQKL